MTSSRQDEKIPFEKRHILCPDYVILETFRDPLNNVKENTRSVLYYVKKRDHFPRQHALKLLFIYMFESPSTKNSKCSELKPEN